jgi:thioredoxin 1
MNRNTKVAVVSVWIVVVIVVASCSWGQDMHATPSEIVPFAPFERWKADVLGADAAGLKGLYSSDPAAQVRVNATPQGADADVNFWIALKARSMKVEFVRSIVRSDRASIIFRAEVVTGLPNGQTVSVTGDQYWLKQGDQWRIAAAERTDAPRLKQPSDMKKNIYPADADAHAEIKEAEERAAHGQKRLLLVFGANWCFDCHVLDLAFQRPDLAPVLVANYEVVHVDLGLDEQKNADIVKQFDAVLNKGIPTMAVAESDGKLVVSQKSGEFEDARGLTPDVLLEFLNKWKPQPR